MPDLTLIATPFNSVFWLCLRKAGLNSVTAALIACLGCSMGVTAQAAESEMTKARVSYEAAKIEIKNGHPKVALQRLESLPDAIQNTPDVQAIMAQANYDLGRIGRAKDEVEEALSSNDQKFMASPSYQTAIELAAKINLKYPAWRCVEDCSAKDDSCVRQDEQEGAIEKAKMHCSDLPVERIEACEQRVDDNHANMLGIQTEYCDKCKERCQRRH